MIPVARARKPKTFDEKVRKPGLRAISEMAGKPSPFPRTAGKPYKQIVQREVDIPASAFPTYWTKALDELMSAYGKICSYSCFRIHPVTGARSADHFAPKSLHWRAVYEWSNYRLCCSRMNSRKNDFGEVLDPFKVGKGWFELELVGFQVIPGDSVKGTPIEQQVDDTVKRLGLNDFCRERAQDAERYWAGDYSLKVLKEDSPFVAYELWRQNRLNIGDAW